MRGSSFSGWIVFYDVGNTPQSVAIGDLNGDSRSDLAIANPEPAKPAESPTPAHSQSISHGAGSLPAEPPPRHRQAGRDESNHSRQLRSARSESLRYRPQYMSCGEICQLSLRARPQASRRRHSEAGGCGSRTRSSLAGWMPVTDVLTYSVPVIQTSERSPGDSFNSLLGMAAQIQARWRRGLVPSEDAKRVRSFRNRSKCKFLDRRDLVIGRA
jgi:hypothetical protein